MRTWVKDRAGAILRTVGEWSPMSRERREVRRFARTFQRGDALVEWYGEDEAAVMRAEMLEEFRRLLPEVPYIGGRRNMFSGFLSGAAQGLAMYRVIVQHGGSLEDTGELMHHRFQARAMRAPRLIRHRIIKPLMVRQMTKAAQLSQRRRYPDDWVMEIVDSRGQDFDFGMDVTECGDVKFLRAQGAEELCPYICDLDYVLFESLGAGLQRTKTLAWGCDGCDFRVSMNGDTTAPWPPRFIEQTCGQDGTTGLPREKTEPAAQTTARTSTPIADSVKVP